MRRYRLGSHARYDLKVHLVWVPKYRKRVLTGAVAVRARDLLRQIAAENDLQIISGKVAADHVHLFLSYRAHQNISQIVQWLTNNYNRRTKVFLRRGEGSGDYSGAMQLKIIHRTQNAQGSPKKATYHLSLRQDVYDALNEVEYANADWDG